VPSSTDAAGAAQQQRGAAPCCELRRWRARIAVPVSASALVNVLFVLPFLLALNLNELSRRYPSLNVDFDAEGTSTHGGRVVIALGAAGLLLGLASQAALLWSEGAAGRAGCRRAGATAAAVLAVLGALTLLLRSTHSVHLHHASVGLFLLPATRLPARSSLLFSGLLAGLFVHGLAAWGWEPVWSAHEPAHSGSYGEQPPALLAPEQRAGAVPTPRDQRPVPWPARISDAGVVLRWPSLNNSRFGGGVLWLNGVELLRGEATSFDVGGGGTGGGNGGSAGRGSSDLPGGGGLLPSTWYRFQLGKLGASGAPLAPGHTLLLRTARNASYTWVRKSPFPWDPGALPPTNSGNASGVNSSSTVGGGGGGNFTLARRRELQFGEAHPLLRGDEGGDAACHPAFRLAKTPGRE
jgi:hypothetical protein